MPIWHNLTKQGGMMRPTMWYMACVVQKMDIHLSIPHHQAQGTEMDFSANFQHLGQKTHKPAKPTWRRMPSVARAIPSGLVSIAIFASACLERILVTHINNSHTMSALRKHERRDNAVTSAQLELLKLLCSRDSFPIRTGKCNEPSDILLSMASEDEERMAQPFDGLQIILYQPNRPGGTSCPRLNKRSGVPTWERL